MHSTVILHLRRVSAHSQGHCQDAVNGSLLHLMQTLYMYCLHWAKIQVLSLRTHGEMAASSSTFYSLKHPI